MQLLNVNILHYKNTPGTNYGISIFMYPSVVRISMYIYGLQDILPS